MPRSGALQRRVLITAALVVLTVVDALATAHSIAGFHSEPNGPSVMTLGEVMGLLSSVVLAVICVLLIVSVVRRRGGRVPTPGRRS